MDGKNKLQKIQDYLRQYIKGQDHVIKLISILLINRDRIERIKSKFNFESDTNINDNDNDIEYPKDELVPPNIMLIGPSGCGKTELTKRIAEISGRFWFRIPCTVLSATGYVGKDVNDILKYAIESAIQKIQEQKRKEIIEQQLDKLLLRATKPPLVTDTYVNSIKKYVEVYRKNPEHPLLEELLVATVPEPHYMFNQKGEKYTAGIFYQEVRDTVKSIIEKLIEGELAKQQEKIQMEAIKQVENGIIMLDEIDKIVGGRLDNVSMYGVQRELLALVEGSTFHTQYGPINTKNILFISAGAFQVVSPDEMLPELRGRFPIRIKLKPLMKKDFVEILKHSRLSPLKKFQTIMKADGINVTFTDDAIEYLAEYAEMLNQKEEQIGARRLWELFDKHLIDLYLLEKDTVITKEMLQELLPRHKRKQKRFPYEMYI